MSVAPKSCVARDRDALADVGVYPIDRTVILRTAALGDDAANLQSIEMLALNGRWRSRR